MKKLLFYLLILIYFISCDHSNTSTKPAHSGAAGEIIVVSSDRIWNNGIDTTMQSVFSYTLPMLPIPEKAFTVLHYTPEQFGMIIERHRNIFVLKIDPKLKEGQSRFEMLKDKWAKHQIVLEITASSTKEIVDLLSKNGSDIIRIINQKENERLSRLFSAYAAKPVMNIVKKKFGINIVFPEGFQVAKDSSDFLWLKREKSRNLSGNMYYIIQNLVIYTSPHNSDSSFSDASILSVRDSFVKKIPGNNVNSYMTTVYSFEDLNLYPVGKDVNIDGNYGRFIRGLWKMENDFMGGPFISLSTYDKENNRIITIEGDIFAPKFSKREYLRELESILFSLRFNKEIQ
jgi:hypothetical protein